MTGRTVRELLAPDPATATVLASTGFAVEPFTKAVCATLSWNGTFRLCSLGGAAGQSPVLKTWSLNNNNSRTEAGAVDDVRFFLARCWEGDDDHRRQSGGGSAMMWRPLWCGDRRTGRVKGVQLARA